MKSLLLLSALLLIIGVLMQPLGAREILIFENPEQEMRYQSLVRELRCTVCQNESLFDSNAPLAIDLRHQIYGMVKEGAEREQVVNYMVSRYGEFVLYRPRMSPLTYALWFGPIILLIIALGALFWVLRSRSRDKSAQTHNAATLTPEEQQRLDRLLAGKD